MNRPLRVLFVEDSEDDVLLLVRKLRAEGFEPEWQRVEDAAGFRSALADVPWDIVLADYALPRFSGLEALKIFKAANVEIPFILVSGTIGEEIAIEAMKAGAVDYIMKDKLARLAPSIRRELDDARVRLEKRRADEALRESVRHWSSTFDAIADGICLLDAAGIALQCNKAHRKFLNIAEADVIGQKCHHLVHGTDHFLERCPFQRMLKSKTHEEEEIAVGDSWFSIAADPILEPDGTVRGAVHIMSDITPRKKAEEKLRASLAEKEVLIREIHHRVKNNMQIMISLLSLQARTIKDKDMADLLKQSQNRIRAMAIVHERLYRSGDLSQIDFADYIENLAVHLFQFFAVEARRIRLERRTEPIKLEINVAIPCALILSELISNVLRHAFPNGRRGAVTVEFGRRPEGRLFLSVKDDGVGFPADVDFRKTESLGLQIVTLLSGQIDGTVDLIRDGGTEFRVEFPETIVKPVS